MRLIKTKDSDRPGWVPQLVDHRGEEYVVLSHVWLPNPNDEVLFSDIEVIDDGGRDSTGIRCQDYTFNVHYCRRPPFNKRGFEKVRQAARWASKNKCDFLWVDTCCIDRSSSAEVSDAVNSAWSWLSMSKMCYAYLHDTRQDRLEAFGFMADVLRSVWFGRSWTLAELIAPPEVCFFSGEWKLIGSKSQLCAVISEITDIDRDIILGARSLDTVSIARRMSWASKRYSSRLEDTAYALIGLFNVSMSIRYGEGDRAFQRLQEEIIKESDDESIFAWQYSGDTGLQDERCGILARHPHAFSCSGDIHSFSMGADDREPYQMTNRGLSIKLRLAATKDGLYVAALHCTPHKGEKGYFAIYLDRLSNEGQQYARVRCDRFSRIEQLGSLRHIYIKQTAIPQRPTAHRVRAPFPARAPLATRPQPMIPPANPPRHSASISIPSNPSRAYAQREDMSNVSEAPELVDAGQNYTQPGNTGRRLLGRLHRFSHNPG